MSERGNMVLLNETAERAGRNKKHPKQFQKIRKRKEMWKETFGHLGSCDSLPF